MKIQDHIGHRGLNEIVMLNSSIATFLNVTNFKLYFLTESCTTVEDKLNVELKIEDSELPLLHGTEIQYRCPQKHVKKNKSDAAVCNNGDIVIPEEPCSKIGK